MSCLETVIQSIGPDLLLPRSRSLSSVCPNGTEISARGFPPPLSLGPRDYCGVPYASRSEGIILSPFPGGTGN